MEKYWNRMTRAELEVELERVNDEIANALFAKEFENWDDLMWARGELVMRLRSGNYAKPWCRGCRRAAAKSVSMTVERGDGADTFDSKDYCSEHCMALHDKRVWPWA